MRHELLGERPQLRVRLFFSRVFFYSEYTSQDSDDIAIQNRCGLVKRDAANGAGGVTANAGEGEHIFEFLRKSGTRKSEERAPRVPIILGLVELGPPVQKNFLRGLLHVAYTRVIAESFPELVNFFGAGFSQRFNAR